MTEAAKKVINCVYEAKGRYGRQIIIDTVAGAKTARLEEIGAVRYKSYGVLAGTNKNLLRRLIEQLVLEGYLRVGDYQVLKLGDISGLKNPEALFSLRSQMKTNSRKRQPKRKRKQKVWKHLHLPATSCLNVLRNSALKLHVRKACRRILFSVTRP